LKDGSGDTCTNKELFLKIATKMAKEALRTIFVCYREMSMEDFNQMKEENNNF
jgi:hypothetical protein